MLTKTILSAAIIFGTASVALASESDPNLLNRYPVYNMTKQVAAPAFQSSNVALTGGHAIISGEQAQFDRASRSTGGGY